MTWLAVMSLLALTSSAQVLQPMGTGLPGRVVASYATEEAIFALYEAVETPAENDYNLAKWDGVTWHFYPGLQTPQPIVPTEGTYNFHSIAYYKGEIYVGAYLANASKDAEIPVTHLYKWSETNHQWLPETGVVDTRNNGIISMTVFDGRLIIAGKFQSTVNGNSVQNIAAYDGTEWTYLGTNNSDQGADGTIRSLMVVKDRLYIAGDFTRFAGDLTGNIAYYTASNGGWGGIGSPFDGEILELASYGDNIAALGKNSSGENEVRIFRVNWSNPIPFETFSKAKPSTISGLSNYLLIGGDFVRDGSGSSLLRYQEGVITFTGNRLSGQFKLGQRGVGAFVWGDFSELNTDIRYFSSLEFATGNLNGYLFFDQNNNCVKDDGEMGIPDAVLRITNKQTNKNWFSVTDKKGRFTVALPEGEYDIEHVSKRHMTSFCEMNYATKITNGRYAQVSLGEYMDPKTADLEVQIHPIYPADLKAGDTIWNVVQITNHGANSVSNGTLLLNHGLPLSDFHSEPEADDYNGYAAIYNISDLKPFETRSVLVRFTMPYNATETDNYSVQVKTGSLLTNTDITKEDNSQEIQLRIGKRTSGTVVKTSDLGAEIPQNKSTWTYTVDFRNTGSQTVNRAVMIDTLSLSLPIKRAILKSFYPISAHYAIQKGNILVVTFDPANLKTTEMSPSTSVGWVQYQIDLYATMPINARVNNVAHMDFDSRWNASSENCQVMVVEGTSKVNKTALQELLVMPNPVNKVLGVNWLPQELGAQWQLIDMMGQTVLSGSITEKYQEINVERIVSGLYVLSTAKSSTKIQVSH